MSRGVEANRGDIVLMVGTRKGAFLLASGQARRNWAVSGPHHAGSDVFHMAYDSRWELLIDYLPPINSVDCGIVV